MAGNAKTSRVLLSAATVMVGPLADLAKLNPAQHSLGLVKNVTLTADPEFRELTQGLTNDVVMSVKVGDGSKLSMEVYEYTPRNLAFAAGLDGTAATYDPITAEYTTSAAPTNTTVALTSAPTGIAVGDFIYVQGFSDDLVHVTKVKSIATNTITLETAWAIPSGMTFPTASKVRKVNPLLIGVQTPQATLAAKITGFIDPQAMIPATILIPKMKITRGLNLNFSTDNYGNMPFEMTPYAQTSSDPMYSEFGTAKLVLMPS